MSRFAKALILICMIGMLAATAEAQTAGLGLRPMRLEIEAVPGSSKTASFMIESPPSDSEVRGRLLLSLTDWTIHEDTSVTYHDAGTRPRSASSWIVFSPGDLTIGSGQQRLVRVTANVPAGTAPGVYTSAIFVQERPPVRQPQKGEQLVFFRFRYVVTLYVIVPPVRGNGEISDVQLERNARGVHLVGQLKNTGTRHLRPNISWFLRSGQDEIVSERNIETTVLLPHSIANETFEIPYSLPPGAYEIEAQVDFHDGQPLQSIKRKVEVVSSSKQP